MLKANLPFDVAAVVAVVAAAAAAVNAACFKNTLEEDIWIKFLRKLISCVHLWTN